eukprot:scaffold12090_cov89-Isochrysis_galbana.AAC.2
MPTREPPHAERQSAGVHRSSGGSLQSNASERGVLTGASPWIAAPPLEHSRHPSGIRPPPRMPLAPNGGTTCALLSGTGGSPRQADGGSPARAPPASNLDMPCAVPSGTGGSPGQAGG